MGRVRRRDDDPAGGFQVIEGLVGLLRPTLYVVGADGALIGVNYTGWGWFHLILGAVVLAAGGGVLAGQSWARILGVVLAGLSAIANLAFVPAYPIWSIIIIAVDVVVIYALLAHGRDT